MIPDENSLGAYIRHLRDHGIADAVGDWREDDGVRTFGVRIGGMFYPVSELRDASNRGAVLRRDFTAVLLNRASAGVRNKRRSRAGAGILEGPVGRECPLRTS
jgi:hypothetical protein